MRGQCYMLIIDIPDDTLTTFRPPTFPQLPLRSQLLLRLLMLQMLYIALQLLHFLFKCIKLCPCQGAIEFFCGALAVFVALTTLEGEGLEEDGCDDKGDEDRGHEAGQGGERAQHGHGGLCGTTECKVLGGFRTWTWLWPSLCCGARDVKPHAQITVTTKTCVLHQQASITGLDRYTVLKQPNLTNI